ncbi:MAG: hypothetical protein ACI4GC_02235 [Acutalibacteraceae bacterium]
MMKKISAIILCVVLVLGCFTACKGEKVTDGDAKSRLLSFSQASSVKQMQELDGQEVSIMGYMSTLSPVNGQFMYLMNLPYQSCPFCVPNTTKLSNTMAVYAEEGKEFEFTDRAIQVTGIMEFGDYTDEFGYEYSYRIKDASYTVLDTSQMSDELKLWQQLASTDAISDVYTMFEYVNFLCYWPTYTAEFESGKDYLYPNDALMFIETDGAQYNYGFKAGYFDNIVATIKSVDETAFSELVEIVESAKTLCDKAYNELKNNNCTLVAEYSNVFGTDGKQQYKLNSADELEKGMDGLYRQFSSWLAQWEL